MVNAGSLPAIPLPTRACIFPPPHHTRAPSLALTGCHSFVSPAAEAEKHMLKKRGKGGKKEKKTRAHS